MNAFNNITELITQEIIECRGSCMRIDGAINFLSLLVLNITFQVLNPLFIEYWQAKLNIETPRNVVSQFQAVVLRLDALVCFKCTKMLIPE